MLNDAGPHYFKIFYRTNSHDHTMQFSVQDGVYETGIPYTDNVRLHHGGILTNQQAMDAIATNLTLFMKAPDGLVRWERYFKSQVNAVPILTQSGNFADGAGVSDAAAIPLSQMHFSFQGEGGNKFGLVILEANVAVNQVIPYASMPNPGTFRSFVDYFTSNINFVTTRGNDYLNTFQRLLTKTNDALRRRYQL